MHPYTRYGLLFCWLLLLCSGSPSALPVTAEAPPPNPVPVGTTAAFLEEFTGSPTTPLPWQPTDWEITVHSRDRETWQTLETMSADHSHHDCGPTPGSHTMSAYTQTVFLCRDHLMTAINASGYGVIYLTPNQMVDFSTGEAVVRFDLSTLRRSNRDWIDLWLTPYEDHLQLPLDEWLPDLQGEPRRAVHIALAISNNSAFRGDIFADFQPTPLPITPEGWQGYETFLTPSATRRDTFELRISRTHLKFGMPAYNFWWIDTPIADLGWSEAVVQFGHHSYNPEKACDFDGTCRANTWHWDNVLIQPARPFTLLRGNVRAVGPTDNRPLHFTAPAPANAHLRFSGIGNNLAVSFDAGATWQPAQKQVQERNAEEHFSSYWTPAPVGATHVQIRGDQWWGGDWHARDFSIWAPPTDEVPPVVTATVTIQQDAQPASIQNFRFTGALGAFALDDATPDDGDAIPHSRTFSVTAGSHTISQALPSGWLLVDIDCTPAAKSQVDRTAGRLRLTVAAGDAITCTFVNQRAATINALTFQDNNGDRVRQPEESWRAGGTMLIYDSYGSAPITSVTDGAGKATFAQLRPDTYTVCEGQQPDWNNTLPGTLHPAHNQPCYALIVRPRQVATIAFGNRPAATAANETAAATPTDTLPDAGGILITDGGDVPFDDSGYAGHALPEVHEHQPVLEQQLFLPFVQQ
jgi:hypothetical protein